MQWIVVWVAVFLASVMVFVAMPRPALPFGVGGPRLSMRCPREAPLRRTMTLMQNPSHPGEVLVELYLEPLGMSAIELARRLHVPRTRIERLVKGDTALTVDSAIRLSTFFGNTPEFWMNLQRSYDLARARESVDVSDIVPLAAA